MSRFSLRHADVAYVHVDLDALDPSEYDTGGRIAQTALRIIEALFEAPEGGTRSHD